jgi:hypothetical protein
MDELPNILILQIQSDHTPRFFFDTLCEADPDARSQHYVRRLTLYKETSNTQHEFVIADLSNSSSLLVERRPEKRASQISILSTSSPSPSTSTVLANDVVQCIPSPTTLTNRLKSCPANILGRYTFKNYPVLEFARLVSVISTQKPRYVINSSMCYWCASTIVAISVAEFGDGTIDSTPSRLAGSWNGYKFMIRVEDIEVMRNAYVQARAADPEPTGPREAKHRRQLKAWETKAKELEELRQQDKAKLKDTEAKLKELQEAQQQDKAKLKELQQENEELRRASKKGSGLAGQ